MLPIVSFMLQSLFDSFNCEINISYGGYNLLFQSKVLKRMLFFFCLSACRM